MTNDFACKLLAYVFVMGGGNESIVLHKQLNSDIKIAQNRLNLYGGVVPDAKLLPTLQKYIKELSEKMEETEWLKEEIIVKYNLKTYKKRKTYKKKEKKMKNTIAKILLTLMAIGIGFIPTWIYIGINLLLSPVGFWQNLFLFGVGLYFLGAIQLVLLILFIYAVITIWMESYY